MNSSFFLKVLLIPFLLFIVILLTPILFVILVILLINNYILRFKKQKKLCSILKENQRKIFLLYTNNQEFILFHKSFKNIHNINLINVNSNSNYLLLEYLTKQNTKHNYPKLVMIHNQKIIQKKHYNSFKYFVKKQNTPHLFCNLLNKSIENLYNAK